MQTKLYRAIHILACCCWGAMALSGQTSADFDYNAANFCAPATLSFNNQSQNAATFAWTVDGAFFSNLANPARTFTQGGSYTVCLTATGQNGQSAQHCESVVIFAPPSLTLAASPAALCPGGTVQLSASSSTPIGQWQWDFGDGTVLGSGTGSQAHSYQQAGSYVPSLSATDVNGCSATVLASNAITVHPQPPLGISADVTGSCSAPLAVQFSVPNASASASYTWQFGDGGTATGSNASHTYSAPGQYDVSLSAVDNATQCSNSLSLPDYISIGNLAAFSHALLPGSTCSAVAVQFQQVQSPNITGIQWQFGDGSSSTAFNPQHVYDSPGCYSPSLIVTTLDGCIANYTLPDCIEVYAPLNLAYTASGPTTACQPGLSLSFSSNYSGPLAWDFGGLGTSTQPNPTFVFDQFGTFPVTLTATLPNGCQEQVTSSSIVIATPAVDFEADTTKGCVGLPVQLTAILPAGTTATAYQWTSGAGQSASGPVANFTYAQAGEYDVSLTATLAGGCQVTVEKSGYIQIGTPPQVNFEATPLETCIENLIGFEDLSTGDPDEWYWEFGDGGFSTQQDIIYEYNDTGYFDVKLIAWNNGCPDSLILSDYVHLLAPKSLFSHSISCDTAGLVQFQDFSIGADTWTWNFGDPNSPDNISYAQNPTHFYQNTGTYTVFLTVYNASTGCYDDVQANIHVTVPQANFTFASLTGCAPFNAQVIDLSVDAENYQWHAPGIPIQFDQMPDPEPVFKFQNPGLYTNMRLTVTDANGCQNVFYFPDTVRVTAVDAEIGLSVLDTACWGQQIQFSDNSTAAFSNIVSRQWQFGDGNSATLANPLHFYGNAGTYQPSLSVSNEYGCSNSTSSSLSIALPANALGIGGDLAGCTGEALAFSAINPGGIYGNFAWSLDGQPLGTGPNLSHAFAQAGEYSLCLSAEDAAGCAVLRCATLAIETPLADFSADQTTADCPLLLVQFNAISLNAVSYLWDFGDGTGLSTLPNPSHSYTQGGSYTVCLSITSANGCQTSVCKENYIQIGGPSGQFSMTPAGGCVPLEVGFSVAAAGFSQYTWDFGDGTVQSGSGTAPSLAHTYTAVGSFTPTLILENAQGCQVLLSSPNPVQTGSISGSFSASETAICAGESLSLTANVAANPSASIQWQWSGPSSGQQAGNQITLDAPGTYDLSLVASSALCTLVLTQNDALLVHPLPDLDLVPSATALCGPGQLAFANNSSIGSGSIGTWAWASSDGQSSAVASPVFNFTAPGTYQIQVSATSAAGCSSADSFALDLYEAAVAEILSSPPPLCNGQSVLLQSQTNGSITWSPAAGLSCSDCPNPVANPAQSTLYTLSVTTPEGCTASDALTVERVFAAPPPLNVSPDVVICQGGSTQLFATGASTPFAYDWDASVPGLSCYQNCSNPIATPSVSSVYTVSTVGSNGCVSSDSVAVEVVGSDWDVLGPDRVICLGESVSLPVLIGANPQWDSSVPGLSCYDCPNPTVTPSADATYAVTVFGQNNCPVSDALFLRVLRPEDVDAGEDLSICAGASIALSGWADGDFVWTENGLPISSAQLNPSVSPAISTVYVLSLLGDACSLSDSVLVQVNERVTLIADDITICEDTPTPMRVRGDATNFQWLPATGLSAADVAEPLVSVATNSSYQLIGWNAYCAPDTVTVLVGVSPRPRIHLLPYRPYAPGEQVQLQAEVEGQAPFDYLWSPGAGLSCADCPNPSLVPEGPQIYALRVSERASGCQDTATVLLRPISLCQGEAFFVPDAFTPNGDGLNDRLYVRSYMPLQHFRVFNRWGELVFETQNPDEGWDGYYKGEALPHGVFTYYVEGTCSLDGQRIILKGDVTLLR